MQDAGLEAGSDFGRNFEAMDGGNGTIGSNGGGSLSFFLRYSLQHQEDPFRIDSQQLVVCDVVQSNTYTS